MAQKFRTRSRLRPIARSTQRTWRPGYFSATSKSRLDQRAAGSALLFGQAFEKSRISPRIENGIERQHREGDSKIPSASASVRQDDCRFRCSSQARICQSTSLEMIVAIAPSARLPLSTAVASVRVILHGPESGVVLSSLIC